MKSGILCWIDIGFTLAKMLFPYKENTWILEKSPGKFKSVNG